MPALEEREATPRLGEALRAAVRTLKDAGVETAQLDARLLLSAATGLDAAALLARPEEALAPADWRRFAALVQRRHAREPVSRILGERAFYGRPFHITPATLDPRPDSETLIEEALAIADRMGWRERPLRILDVGTGSGCLIVTLLAELAQATGLATDIDEAALAAAAANARRHSVAGRAMFERRDALCGVGGGFNLVVCNPPYVATGDIAGLAPEVREHDPRAALDGGADGLEVYRKIIPGLAGVVASGWVLFEVGAGQAEAVSDLLQATLPGAKVRRRKDLAGRERCVSAEIQL